MIFVATGNRTFNPMSLVMTVRAMRRTRSKLREPALEPEIDEHTREKIKRAEALQKKERDRDRDDDDQNY